MTFPQAKKSAELHAQGYESVEGPGEPAVADVSQRLIGGPIYAKSPDGKVVRINSDGTVEEA